MKQKELVEKMTLEEKAAILSGKTVWQTREIPRLGIPAIFCADGPHGVRKQAGAGDHLGLNASLPATCFPTAATVANSWDTGLAEEIGKALGEEAYAQDVQVLLGPGLNIKRSPLCGRNFEYFSEDPYIAGKMAAAYVRGIQSQGVAACPKHFAVNSQELRRMAMNAVVDERTLREIYLTGFEIAVKEGKAEAIMSSYNEVNGEYANENQHLLQEILRKEWGFDGIVITDWGGSNDHVKAVKVNSNLEMPAPGLDSARELISAVKSGTLSMEELDICVDHLVNTAVTLKRQEKERTGTIDEKNHHQLARRAAAESAVLLKNEDRILPLPPRSRVAVIGDFSVEPRYQGAGSSMVNPTRLETIKSVIGEYNLQVQGIHRGYRRNGEEDETLRKEALDLAEKADIVLFFFGLDELSESEGMDRNHMRIPQNQIDLLGALSQVNVNVVGILSAGAAIEMPWHTCCKAILHGYLNGQAGAGAILDLLTGKVNPSGHLSETYPLRLEDTPAYRNFPGKERNAEYREGLYVGYRYYDYGLKQVLYPFGFGLSYTTFTYSDLVVDREGVTFTLCNTGIYDGAEVSQLYIALPEPKIFRPEKELKGFVKVFLKAGESRRVHIPFDDKTFRYWNVKTNRWEIEGGNYQIVVAASASDLRLVGRLVVEGTTEEYPYDKTRVASYFSRKVWSVSDQEFEALLGHPVPSGKWAGELGVNDAVCQMFYAKSRLARLVYKQMTAIKKKSEEKGKPDLNILFMYNMPFRAIAKMTNGAVSMEMVEGIVAAVNGHFFRGVKQVMVGYLRNRRKNRQYEKQLSKE